MFPNARVSRAAYDLGSTLRSEGDYPAAAQAFESAASRSGPDRGRAARATLSAGEMYDLAQQRNTAIKKYEEVIAMDGDSPDGREARRLMKKPLRLP